MRFVLISLMTIVISLSGAVPSGAQAITKSEENALRRAVNSQFGCTAAKRRMQRAKKKFRSTRFAFAGRTAPMSITGMKGCGYSWGKSQSSANRRALTRCRKWERRFGTKGGRTCKLLKL